MAKVTPLTLPAFKNKHTPAGKTTNHAKAQRKDDVLYIYDRSRLGKASRTFFILKTESLTLEFWINPSECSWRVPLRTTIEPIQGGAVHHEWYATGIGEQHKQKYDQPVLNFTFQAGHIAPQNWSTNDYGRNPGKTSRTYQALVAPGLANFYDFLALLNEPNIKTDGTPNYVEISYASLMMPNIQLKGFFTQEGVQWSDNADNPSGISSWGASFVVFESTPLLFERNQLRNQYLAIFNDTTAELIEKELTSRFLKK